MTKEFKLRIFKSILDNIDNSIILRIVSNELSELPDAFFINPSSTNLSHPPETRGYAGLTIHVKLAINYAMVLCSSFSSITQFDKDLIIAALLIHDGYKYGIDGLSDKVLDDHPILMADHLNEKANQCSLPEAACYKNLSDLVRSHHGRWGNEESNLLLNRIVHESDLLAKLHNRISHFNSLIL